MLTAIESSKMPGVLKEHHVFSALSFSKFAEAGWFLLCLALFTILGPFAAPIAIGAVLACQSREERQSLPEPEFIE